MIAVDAKRSLSCRQQRGSAMVEFAFIFPFLFLLIYGCIVYAYIFVLQQSMNFAAQEAAESAVAVDPDLPSRDSLRASTARARATRVLRWLPDTQTPRVLGPSGEKVEVDFCLEDTPDCPNDADGIRVTLKFSVAEPTYLFPVLNIFIVTGQVPPMPATLIATGMARLPKTGT